MDYRVRQMGLIRKSRGPTLEQRRVMPHGKRIELLEQESVGCVRWSQLWFGISSIIVLVGAIVAPVVTKVLEKLVDRWMP